MGASASRNHPFDLPDPTWTPRQREVLDLLLKGSTNTEIAQALGITRDGAKWHVSEIISKLGVESREEVAEYWRARNGLRLRFLRFVRSAVASAALAKATAGLAAFGAVSATAVILLVTMNGSGGATPEASQSVAAVPVPSIAASSFEDVQRQLPFPLLYPESSFHFEKATIYCNKIGANALCDGYSAWVEISYRDGSSNDLTIAQGYFGMPHGQYLMARPEWSGTTTIDGKAAWWIDCRAVPEGQCARSGEPGATIVADRQSLVGWKENKGEGSRQISVTSHQLSVDNLERIARSLH